VKRRVPKMRLATLRGEARRSLATVDEWKERTDARTGIRYSVRGRDGPGQERRETPPEGWGGDHDAID